MDFRSNIEELKVQAKDLVAKVKAYIHEGNVRRIIIKDDHGNTFIEIPLTVAAIGAVGAPILAAVGAIAALVAHFTIVLERSNHGGAHQATHESTHASPGADSNLGATEAQVNMSQTVPQRIDNHGTKVEDLAGTGGHDSKGG